jgi:hypothetical protein
VEIPNPIPFHGIKVETFDHYRCHAEFTELIGWLRSKGVYLTHAIALVAKGVWLADQRPLWTDCGAGDAASR